MERFDMVPLFEEEDVRHQFLSGRGTGEREASTGRRLGQVVWAYVVEVYNHLLSSLFLLNTAAFLYSTQKRTRSRTSSRSIRCLLPSWRIRGIHSYKLPISITTRPKPPL